MGKWKVKIHRLTLDPGSLGCLVQREKEADQDVEEVCLRDHKLLHNALEVVITSTSSWKIHPHIHGVVNKIEGQFWASDNNSKTSRSTARLLP
jgi:hypothetical protein